MNNLDKQYQQLLQDILDYGVEKKDRTGTGTKSIFGYTIRHKMSDGFPLLTTKKMPFKTIVTELLWFLKGDTNIKYLVDNNCHIWDGDAYKNFEKQCIPGTGKKMSQEEFIEFIKTNDEFAKQWGELGPIYGKQWRQWGGLQDLTDDDKPIYLDQIANLIKDVKTNPDSRRLMVNAWNVGEIDQMVLPPCHYGFQVYTRELSDDEQRAKCHPTTPRAWDDLKEFAQLTGNSVEEAAKAAGIPTRAISLMWNQRSVDTGLGLGFNIASYGLLLEIIAKEVNMVPDELVGNLGDVHLYLDHVEPIKEQIGKELTARERTALGSNGSAKLYDMIKDGNYMTISADDEMHKVCDEAGVIRHTREPFKLPTLSYSNEYHYLNDTDTLGDVSFSEKISKFRPDFFKLENYQSHPKIYLPLSN